MSTAMSTQALDTLREYPIYPQIWNVIRLEFAIAVSVISDVLFAVHFTYF